MEAINKAICPTCNLRPRSVRKNGRINSRCYECENVSRRERRNVPCRECGGPSVSGRCLRCYLISVAKDEGAKAGIPEHRLLFPRAYPGDVLALSQDAQSGYWVFEVLQDGYELRLYDDRGVPSIRRITTKEFEQKWFVVKPNIMHPNGKHLEPDPDFLEAISDERREWLMTARSVKA